MKWSLSFLFSGNEWWLITFCCWHWRSPREAITQKLFSDSLLHHCCCPYHQDQNFNYHTKPLWFWLHCVTMSSKAQIEWKNTFRNATKQWIAVQINTDKESEYLAWREAKALKRSYWGTVLKKRKKRNQSFLPMLRGCRSGVKPAWLSLCFSLCSLQAAAGFLLTRGNDGLISGRDLEGTGNSMAVLWEVVILLGHH